MRKRIISSRGLRLEFLEVRWMLNAEVGSLFPEASDCCDPANSTGDSSSGNGQGSGSGPNSTSGPDGIGAGVPESSSFNSQTSDGGNRSYISSGNSQAIDEVGGPELFAPEETGKVVSVSLSGVPLLATEASYVLKTDPVFQDIVNQTRYVSITGGSAIVASAPLRVPPDFVGRVEYWFEGAYGIPQESPSPTVYETFETGRSTFVVHDRTNSSYGSGWWQNRLDFLREETSGQIGVSWIQGESGATFYEYNSSTQLYARRNGVFATLEKLDLGSGNYEFEIETDLGETLVFQKLMGDPENRFLLAERMDPSGNRLTYSYADKSDLDTLADDLETVTDQFGRTNTYTYASTDPHKGLVTKVTDYLGRETIYTYAVTNRNLISVQHVPVLSESGNTVVFPTTLYTYNPLGLLETVTNPRGLKTSYTYGHAGRLEKTTFHDVSGSGALFLGEILATSMVGSTLADFDSTTGDGLDPNEPVAATLEAEFAATITDPRGYTSEKKFDAFRQLKYLKDALGNEFWVDRDSHGRVIAERKWVSVGGSATVNPTETLVETDYIYDDTSFGIRPYLQEIIHPDSKKLEFLNFNNKGRPQTLKDELGRQTNIVYDDTDVNVISVTQILSSNSADNIIYSYEYTAAPTTSPGLPGGLLKKATDPLGNITEYEYFESIDPEVLGRLEKVTYCGAVCDDQNDPFESYDYAYDFHHGLPYKTFLVTHTDALGRVTKSTFDQQDRLIRKEQPEISNREQIPTTHFRYDLVGNLRFVIDAEGNPTEYVYDAASRLISVKKSDPDTNEITSNSPTTQYRYDPAGNLRAAIDPVGRITSYFFDPAGRQIAIAYPDVDGVPNANMSLWTNPIWRYDVNADGIVDSKDVTALDVFLATVTSVSLSSLEAPETYGFFSTDLNQDDSTGIEDSPFYFDVNGDNTVNAADKTAVIANLSSAPPVITFSSSDQPLSRAREIFHYDDSENLMSSTDRNGNVTKYRYDNRERQTHRIEPSVYNPATEQMTLPTTLFTYDYASQLTSVTDPRGFQTDFAYDAIGRLVRRSDPDINTISFSWHNPDHPFDVNGDGKVDASDEQVILEELEEPVYHNPEYPPPPNDGGLLIGSRTTGQPYFDVNDDGWVDSGDLSTVSNFVSTGVMPNYIPIRPRTRYVYDKASNLRFVIDAMQSVVEYRYDERNNLEYEIGEQPIGPKTHALLSEVPRDISQANVRETFPVIQYIRDDMERVESIVDFRYDASQGAVTDPSYNELDFLVGMNYPDPDGDGNFYGISEFNYEVDFLGNRLSVTDSLDNTTNYTLDHLYRVYQELKPLVDNGDGQDERPTTTFLYTAANEVEEIIDPLLRHTKYLHDGQGRRNEIQYADPESGAANGTNSPLTVLHYDLNGNMISESVAGPSGQTFTKYWQYDALNRMTQSTDERSKNTLYTYDLTGNLFSLKDPNENLTTWVYDSNQRLTSETVTNDTENFGTRTFSYDLEDNRISKTDRRGWVTEYTFDNLYRPTRERWIGGGLSSDRDMTFGFDLAGNMTSASDPGFTHSYTPDRLGRIGNISSTYVGLTPTVNLAINYNLMSRQTTTTATVGASDDFLTTRIYDELQRVKTITQGSQGSESNVSSKRIDIKYDLANQLKTLTRHAALDDTNTVSQTMYLFDKTGRLKDLEHRNKLLEQNPLAKYTLTWDKANRIDTITSLVDGFADYDYDNASQLTSVAYSNYGPFQLDEGYYYDDNGNRLSAEFVDGNPIELSAYWEMEEGIGNSPGDSSGNSLTLSFTGGPAWVTSDLAPIPNNSYGLSFPTKNDYLTLSSASSLQPGAQDFSASTWLKSSSSITSEIPIMGFGLPNSIGGKGFEFVYRAGASGKPLVLRINDGSGGPQTVSYSTDGSLADGTWHHLGFSIDRDGQVVLYIDGRAVRAAASTQNGTIAPTGSFLVARAPGISMTTSSLPRWMDETRVYHYAVSAADMQNQYLGKDDSYTAEYEIGSNNQLLSDGDFGYDYDDEGNRLERSRITGMDTDFYTWDHRNRLTKVERTGPQDVFWLNFESDDGTLIVDSLGNAVDGTTVNNAYVDYATSHGGDSDANSLHLDGNGDFVDMGIQDVFRPGEFGLTLMAWMYPEASAPMNIVSFGAPSASEPGYSLTYERTSGGHNKFVLKFSDGLGSTFDTATYSVSAASFVNSWHHVAVAVDDVNNEIELYLDGTSAQTWTLSETMAWGPVLQPFLIGLTSVAVSDHFKGQLDEIRVAPYALDASAIGYAEEYHEPDLVNIQLVEYVYDHQNRLISWERDVDGNAGPSDSIREFFIHDGAGQSMTSATPDPDNLEQVGQVVLRLDAEGDVTHRYLWGQDVDQLLADEYIATAGTAGETRWALGDQLGSVRDVVKYNAGTATVESLAHRAFDSFGNITNEENVQSIDLLFGYTGRAWDDVAELQNNLNRWYDPSVGRWISEDPIGFAGGDANLVRYVTNSVSTSIDPSGLKPTKGNQGEPNLNTVASELGNGNWLVISVISNGNFGGGSGHSSIATVSNSGGTSVINSGGFGPAGGAPRPIYRSVPGEINDDSNMQFAYFRAYPLTNQQFNNVNDKINQKRRNPGNYQVRNNNCTTWTIDVLNDIIPIRVPQDQRNIGVDPSLPNPPPFYSPSTLLGALQGDPTPGTVTITDEEH